MICKNCHKQVMVTLKSVKSFCSHQCKNEYRKKKRALYYKEKRRLVSISSTNTQYPEKCAHFSTITIGKIRVKNDTEDSLRRLKRCLSTAHDWRVEGSKVYCASCGLTKVSEYGEAG